MGTLARARYKLVQHISHKTTFYEGGRFEAIRNSVFTPIADTYVDFVFTSAALGLKESVIPLDKAGSKAGKFTVHLAFSAPPGDAPGQRVFDVKLQGKVVLKAFDIVKEARGTDKAVWKKFTDIASDGDLRLTLVAGKDKPSAKEMPLINGIQILRQD